MSVGDPQSFNRYSYVGNDPVNLIDPSGLDKKWSKIGKEWRWPPEGTGTREPEFWRSPFLHRERDPQHPIPQPQQNDPCAGKKGIIDPNKGGGLKAGIEHISDRHIEPQGSKWQRGKPNAKSYFTFGSIGTKGSLSITKNQKEDIVLGMMQEAFEKGAANKLPGGDYAYSYAPMITTVNTPLGEISGAAFIGMDRDHGWDFTNVRTVVLNVTDCQHPVLITGYQQAR